MEHWAMERLELQNFTIYQNSKLTFWIDNTILHRDVFE